MTTEQRMLEVSAFLPEAAVSVAALDDSQLELAQELCRFFEIPLGSLLRRADACRLAGGHDNTADCLREAAQHLVILLD